MYASYCLSTHRRLSLHAVFLTAFGGEYFDIRSGVFAEAWEYDPKTDAWRAVKNMRTPRHGLGAATIGRSIYVVGGATGVGGGTAVGTNERFLPPPAKWVKQAADVAP